MSTTGPGPTVQVEVTPRIEDHEEAHSLLTPRIHLRECLIVLIAAIAVGVVVFITRPESFWGFVSILVFAFVAAPVVMFASKLFRSSIPRMMYDALIDMREPRTYTFTEQGIEFKGEHSSGACPWEVVAQVRRTTNLLLILVRQQNSSTHPEQGGGNSRVLEYIPIPFRCFTNDEEQVKVIQLVRSKVRDCRL